AEVGGRRFVRLAFTGVQIDQAFDDLRDAACGYLGGQPREHRAAVVGSTADHHEVLRHGPGAETPDAALESERGDVMLSAAIRAAADLDACPVGGRNQVGT